MSMENTTVASDTFALQHRRAGGGTKPLTNWGFRNETDPLTDVLLGPADHLRHMATSSLSRKTLREHPADILVAKRSIWSYRAPTPISVCAYIRIWRSPNCPCWFMREIRA